MSWRSVILTNQRSHKSRDFTRGVICAVWPRMSAVPQFAQTDLLILIRPTPMSSSLVHPVSATRLKMSRTGQHMFVTVLEAWGDTWLVRHYTVLILILRSQVVDPRTITNIHNLHRHWHCRQSRQACSRLPRAVAATHTDDTTEALYRRPWQRYDVSTYRHSAWE